MTDEELQETIQEISESLDKLSGTEKPLTKEEKRRKRVLLLKKDLLQKAKQARDKQSLRQEYINLATYSFVASMGEKHPILMWLLLSRFRWTMF